MAKHVRRREPRPLSFYLLAAFFGLFVLFLYGPIATIVILSFQGPNGGLTFPMNGVSTHWFHNLFQQQAVGDFGGSLTRSLSLGVIVMVVTVLFAVSAGLAFRRRFFGSGVIFYIAVASLIVPSILVSLGIGLMFNIMEWEPNWYSSGLGAHLTWTLPFGLLIMFAVFNRFNAAYEEAARDLGATPWQAFVHVVLPLIGPSLVGVGMFGFTLSWDEIARSSQAMGDLNTLPLELQGLTTTVTTPVIYALGTVTTVVSFLVMGVTLGVLAWWRRRRG
jgi:putative spermidine/putrescine transport system permease protein